MPQRPQLELANFFPYLINRVGFALVERFTRDALDQHHLSIAMWRVLAVLSHNGEQRQIDIAELTTIDVSTLSRLLTRIQRMGLITRARSRSNNREVVVALSPKGRALVNRLIPVAQRLERDAIAGLPEGELAIVRRSLRRMFENLTGSRTDLKKAG